MNDPEGGDAFLDPSVSRHGNRLFTRLRQCGRSGRHQKKDAQRPAHGVQELDGWDT